MGEQSHECEWKNEVSKIAAELERSKAEIEALKRHIFGKKSEKMPPMSREIRRGKKPDPVQSQRTREKNAELKAATMTTETVETPVPEPLRGCPKCGKNELQQIASPKPTTIVDYVPGHFRRRIYNREKLVCACGKHVVTAPVPAKVFEKTQYGPGFMAYLVVTKTLDSMPLYRLEKSFQRLGMPISRSTMNTLYNRVGDALGIIARKILAQVAASDIVLADETTHRTQECGKRPYVWTFIAGKSIAYCFSPDRSGQTPKRVLGGTQGTLVVDAYTGYNAVTQVDGRERAGCLAHARRKFFDALKDAPEAKTALEIIRQVYIVEQTALEQGVARTPEHLKLRKELSLPLMESLQLWMKEREPLQPPKSKLGRAISYARKNWEALTRFLENPLIPPDNNRSERALRVVALGRKNFLFVGNTETGTNLANLYTVLATCEANGVNPQAYLTDILTKLDSTPASKIDELLPENWRPPPASS